MEKINEKLKGKGFTIGNICAIIASAIAIGTIIFGLGGKFVAIESATENLKLSMAEAKTKAEEALAKVSQIKNLENLSVEAKAKAEAALEKANQIEVVKNDVSWIKTAMKDNGIKPLIERQ